MGASAGESPGRNDVSSSSRPVAGDGSTQRVPALESPDEATLDIGPSTVRFNLFGPIEVRTSTRRIGVSDFPSRKAKQVCQLLAGAAGRPVSKDRLIDALWGAKLPRNPSAAVDHTISLLRSVVAADDGAQPIVTECGHYRIDLSIAEIDLVRFDQLVDGSSTANLPAALPALLEAVELAQGTVLEDEMYAPWASMLRDHYGQRVQRVLLDVARGALVDDDPHRALAMAQRARYESVIVLEEGFALCISALIRLGRRHDARILMIELERRMAAELGAELAPETMMLRSMLRGSGAYTPLELPVAARVTQPIDALSFIGRESELATIDAAVRRCVDGASEMIVVQGASGIGKSALLAAIESRPDCPVRSFACLPSDTPHSLYTVHRLMRSLVKEAGLESIPPVGESVAAAFHRLAALLDAIGPTVITIDDVHLADDASLAVIVGLTRPYEVGSLLVIASRDLHDAVGGDRCEVVLAGASTIELAPLTRSVIDTLEIEAAWDETGGHPGLLSACVEACRSDGNLSPRAVADVLASVGPDGSAGRVMLEAAAQLGRSFTAKDLAAVVGLCPQTVIEVLADLERLHVIDAADPNEDRFEFRAALAHRALLDTAQARRILTERVAQATSGGRLPSEFDTERHVA